MPFFLLSLPRKLLQDKCFFSDGNYYNLNCLFLMQPPKFYYLERASKALFGQSALKGVAQPPQLKPMGANAIAPAAAPKSASPVHLGISKNKTNLYANYIQDLVLDMSDGTDATIQAMFIPSALTPDKTDCHQGEWENTFDWSQRYGKLRLHNARIFLFGGFWEHFGTLQSKIPDLSLPSDFVQPFIASTI